MESGETRRQDLSYDRFHTHRILYGLPKLALEVLPRNAADFRDFFVKLRPNVYRLSLGSDLDL